MDDIDIGTVVILGLVIAGFVYGLYWRLKLLFFDAHSDDIAVRREALYKLGNEFWGAATSDLNKDKTHNQRERDKDRAVEYWMEAAELGHEGAMNKLRMAQIRRG